jgi:glycosyltransferase involved in cell wall biosynthesis
MRQPVIAIVAPFGADPVNGVLVAAVAAAAAASHQGAAVEMWLPHAWPNEGFDAFSARLEDAGVSQVVLDLKEPARQWLRPGALRRARQRAVDLVHLHSVFSPHIWQLAWAVRRPTVITPHGGYSPAALQRGRTRKRVVGAGVERPTLRRADAVVALTDAEAAHLRQWCARCRVEVIPNGVDPAPAVDRGALRRELGVGPETPVAVYAGRLDQGHKGLDHLVAGLADAPGWALALVGPDDRLDRAAIEGQARELGIRDRCHFLGLRQGERLHEALAGADAFTLTSRWEGLPLTLLEALAHGTPAVVTPPVEAAVPVAARGAGWVCAPDEVGAALRAVAALGADERAERAARARELAASYRWDAVGARLAALYERVARRD